MIATRSSRGHVVGRVAMCFVALAVLMLPFFAHGCHRDELDHEPLVIPFKSSAAED